MNKDNNNKDVCQAHHDSIAAAAASQPKKDRRLCKALLCKKFKQGKCNGFCVVCFNQFGATTCRDSKCMNGIHKDGYCSSHFANVNDTDTTATKPASESATNPAPESAKTTTMTTKNKKIATPSQPSKQVKRKREHRIRYTFPATSSHQSLRIDANSKNPRHQTISKDDLRSLFDSVLKETRHTKSVDGKALYLLDEIRDNIISGLKPSSHKVTKKPLKLKKEAPVEIQGIPEDSFTADEIALMPVVFSYHCEDIESEQNAKIATLDYEVEQNRLKRKAAMGDESNPTSGQSGTKEPVSSAEQGRLKRKAAMCDESNLSSGQASKKEPVSSAEHKSDSPIEDETEKEPDDEFPPSGWVTQHVPRKIGTSNRPVDTYYYSPKLQLKFRSKPEVKRFVALLDSSGNDEEKAFAEFRGR
jgi:hypothetical protein